jgi:hypothetical protein
VGEKNVDAHCRSPEGVRILHSKASRFAALATVSLLGIGATRSVQAATTWTFDFTKGQLDEQNIIGLSGCRNRGYHIVARR